MRKRATKKAILFTTALTQVMLVAMNVRFIATGQVVAMLIIGFLISLVWTFNISKVAFGTIWDKVTYATGAMVGTGIGFWISHLITK